MLQWFIYLTIRVYIKWKLLDLQQKRTLVIMTEYDIPRGTVSLSCSWSWRVFCRSHLLYGMMAIGWHQWENTLVLNNKTTMRGPIRSKTYWFVFECKQNRWCLFNVHELFYSCEVHHFDVIYAVTSWFRIIRLLSDLISYHIMKKSYINM